MADPLSLQLFAAESQRFKNTKASKLEVPEVDAKSLLSAVVHAEEDVSGIERRIEALFDATERVREIHDKLAADLGSSPLSWEQNRKFEKLADTQRQNLKKLDEIFEQAKELSPEIVSVPWTDQQNTDKWESLQRSQDSLVQAIGILESGSWAQLIVSQAAVDSGLSSLEIAAAQVVAATQTAAVETVSFDDVNSKIDSAVVNFEKEQDVLRASVLESKQVAVLKALDGVYSDMELIEQTLGSQQFASHWSEVTQGQEKIFSQIHELEDQLTDVQPKAGPTEETEEADLSQKLKLAERQDQLLAGIGVLESFAGQAVRQRQEAVVQSVDRLLELHAELEAAI